jgi:hypothetical protein
MDAEKNRYFWFDERDQKWHKIESDKYNSFQRYMSKWPEIASGLRLVRYEDDSSIEKARMNVQPA